MSSENKLWGGRFEKTTDALVHQFNESLSFDKRLYPQDITGSIAWAKALERAGVLKEVEVMELVHGLEAVRTEFLNGTIEFAASDEDIHTAVERRLTEIVGSVGGKLHTGRSRNDQVATDFRLWVMQACTSVIEHIRDLQAAIVESAQTHLTVMMPGYTHLQHAQPITWGHFILTYFWMLERDVKRFEQALEMASASPLGSAALAGTGFPIDREALAADLGFASVIPNSLDAVSDRDFAADFMYAATTLGLHLSRLSEQLIIYSSAEFGFVRLDDAYSTGSSLMPQKKNPDTLELTRGKAGRLLGNFVGLLTLFKGLPSSGYDKDLQEDKEPLFDTYDNLGLILPVMAGAIRTLTINPKRMAMQLEASLLATDLADYLVKKGMPFREAHGVVGKVVRLAEIKEVPIDALPMNDLQTIHEMFTADVRNILDMSTATERRSAIGGTSKAALDAQLGHAKAKLA